MESDSPIVSPLLLTTRDAARVLAISPRTLWALTQSGAIPSIRVGTRSVRYSVDALRKYIEGAAQVTAVGGAR